MYFKTRQSVRDHYFQQGSDGDDTAPEMISAQKVGNIYYLNSKEIKVW